MKILTNEEYVDILSNSVRVYPYGSTVYGTFNSNSSDRDFIRIMKNEYAEKIADDNQAQFSCQNGEVYQMTMYTEDEFFERLKNCEIDILECVFSNSTVIRKLLPDTYTVDFYLYPDDVSPLAYVVDKEKIRDNFSKTASNSWVKCKKKLTVEKDFSPYIGKKSLWHSLRLIDFGTQIMCFGKIVNFSSMNFLYKDIVLNEDNNWENYKNKYQSFYNKLKTNFRLSEQEGFQYMNPKDVYHEVEGTDGK